MTPLTLLAAGGILLLTVPVHGQLPAGTSTGQSGIEAYLNQAQNTEIHEGFKSPPQIARVMATEWWVNGFLTKDGLTKDLESFAKNGLAGCHLMDAAASDWGPVGSVRFLSPEWLELMDHAVRESARLGLDFGFHNGPGTSQSGGPWITPRLSMKQLVWRRADVAGPREMAVANLPKPAELFDSHYYEDALVVAFPKVDAMPRFNETLQKVTVNGGKWGEFAVDGCFTSSALLQRNEATRSSVVDFELGQEIATTSFFLDFPKWLFSKEEKYRLPWDGNSSIDVELQTVQAQDARTFHTFTIRDRPLNCERLCVKFADITAAHFRAVFRFKGCSRLFVREMGFLGDGERPLWDPEIKNLESKMAFADASPGRFRRDPSQSVPRKVVAKDKILVFKTADGGTDRLALPAGEWTVLRFGFTTTGAINGPCSPTGGSGLECDKLDAEAVTAHFNAYAKVILDRNREYAGTTIRLIDLQSWEVKFQNWTKRLPENFASRRGYDVGAWMPVFAGFTVGSVETTERFLFDYLRTLADMVAENYFGTMRRLCNAYGVCLMDEGLYNWATHNGTDVNLNWSNVDIPMSEFWYDWNLALRNRKELQPGLLDAAHAACLYGKRVHAAEAFTSMDKDYWRISPFEIKDTGDIAFAQGVNRYSLNVSTHQAGDAWPGYWGASAGVRFDRNNPWFNYSKGFFDYVARCQFLLQRGAMYADVLGFYGQTCPPDPQLDQNGVLPAGYRSVLANADALIKHAVVRDGRITFPDGASFAVLVLPARNRIDYDSLVKMEQLVRDGAVVLGQKPTLAHTLEDYPRCDAQIAALADKIWQQCDGVAVNEVAYGKGKVFWNVPLAAVLEKLAVPPDFQYTTGSDKRQVVFFHRTDGPRELYYVANLEDRDVRINATFGHPRRHAEIWHPEFGEVFPVEHQQRADGRATIELSLGRKEAFFVVFTDEKTPRYSHTANLHRHAATTALTVPGPWRVSFEPKKMKAPDDLVLTKLEPLDQNADEKVRHFSGYITYRTSFQVPENLLGGGLRLVLDLGEVNLLAEVAINGKRVANLWKPPFSCDVTEHLKPGQNELAILVVNHLANRLVGDTGLPENERVLWSPVWDSFKRLYKKDSPLMPSGLAGPVEIKSLPANYRSASSAPELTAQGPAVVVRAGGTFPLAVAPAPIVSVTNDPPYLLSTGKPGFASGTRLRGMDTLGINAFGSMVPGSLTLRRCKDGKLLKPGEDYLLDEAWGHIGIGPRSCVTTKEPVSATYRYSLLRMDTIQIAPNGNVTLKPGKPHISAPLPPPADSGCTALAHVFVNYGDTEVKADRIYPITETPVQAVTGSTAGRIPKTLAKLKAGGEVTIVCWGDSVTAGGNASRPDLRYVDVFSAGLRERFPKAKIEVKNISHPGSHSRQWLFPEKFPFPGSAGAVNPRQFQRVLDAKPDLVTIEFVNDAGMTPAMVEETYSDILQRLQGSEVILITPHFTMPATMGFQSLREPERRPYVLALRDFATKHHVALADAAARWEHLWKEGLPYVTLLHNTVNHPDDRGHRLFAEELWKCCR